MLASLTDVTERLFIEFDGQIPFPDVMAVVRDCQGLSGSERDASIIERRIHQQLRALATRRALSGQAGV
jgi:hypothetical protein